MRVDYGIATSTALELLLLELLLELLPPVVVVERFSASLLWGVARSAALEERGLGAALTGGLVLRAVLRIRRIEGRPASGRPQRAPPGYTRGVATSSPSAACLFRRGGASQLAG